MDALVNMLLLIVAKVMNLAGRTNLMFLAIGYEELSANMGLRPLSFSRQHPHRLRLRR